jgi:hypothetical protein
MPSLSAEALVDLVQTTQNELGRMRWTEIATDIQEHHALPQLLRKEKVKIESGVQIQRNLQVTTSKASHHFGMFGTDKLNVGETMKAAIVPWRHTTTNWVFERREVEMNRNPAKIVDLVKTRRADAMIDMADLIEQTFWDKPATSADDLTPWGIKMWIVKDVSAPGGAFTAALPAGGFTTVAGLDPAVYTRWRNWAFQTEDPTAPGGYTKTSGGTIPRMRKAWRKIHFKCPIDIPNYKRGEDRYVIYCNESSIAAFEAVGEAQNEGLGRDIASLDDQITFRRAPIRWVPFLDADTTHPVYMVNWADYHIYCLDDEYLREDPPEKAPNQHTTFKTHIDLTWNTFLTNRRKTAVGTLS